MYMTLMVLLPFPSVYISYQNRLETMISPLKLLCGKRNAMIYYANIKLSQELKKATLEKLVVMLLKSDY